MTSPAGSGARSSLLNFPLALGAIALAAIAGGPRLLVGAAIALCAVTALPGVVDQDDLDARWINAVPALGVALALGLTVAAVRRDGAAFARHARGDRLRIVLGVCSCCWRCRGWPRRPGSTSRATSSWVRRSRPCATKGSPPCISGFTTARPASCSRWPRSRSRARPASRALAAYLSLMLAYGLANALQDGWNEQLWKRGSVDHHLESVLRPDLSVGWLTILVGAGAIYAFWFRPSRER